MKMYIVVKNEIPDELIPVIAAHASLACYLQFKDDERMIRWINGVFRKVVCSASNDVFEKLKNEGDFICLTESVLDNIEVSLAFCPRDEYPKIFKYLSKWKPSGQKK
ncbi:MAG: hypothetical protein U0Y96_02400 [Candidatus Kapaibacterium sp.]|nr:hypothetical protein [Bacteroidota bacterium]